MRKEIGYLALSALLILVSQVVAQGGKPAPDVDIEKATNGVDADNPAAGDAPVLSPGDPITWTYIVTNTGPTDLVSIVVTDDQGVAVICPKDTLVPGESMLCMGMGVADDLTTTPFTLVPGLCENKPTTDMYRNIGKVTAESPTGQMVMDDDPSHYCNPDDIPPPSSDVCVPHNRAITLTHNQTRVLNVQDFFDLDSASCPVGYIIAWANTLDKTPIEWNHLSGSTYIRSPGGPGLNRTKGAQAVAVLGDPANMVVEGAPLVGAAGGAFPDLPFDGVAYAELGTVLRTDFVADTPNRYSRLTLVAPDITNPLANPATQIGLNWWNQAEDSFSGSLEYRCMVRQQLSDVQGAFAMGALGSFYGNLKATSFGDVGIVGAIEELEPNRMTLRNLFNNQPSANPVISNGGRQPGSAVIFPLFDISGVNPERTVIRITNNHPNDDVDVHLFAVCGEDR